MFGNISSTTGLVSFCGLQDSFNQRQSLVHLLLFIGGPPGLAADHGANDEGDDAADAEHHNDASEVSAVLLFLLNKLFKLLFVLMILRKRPDAGR